MSQFPFCCCDKMPGGGEVQLIEEGLILAPNTRLWSIISGWSRQELDPDGHMHSQEQRVCGHTCVCPPVPSPVSTRVQSRSQTQGSVLPTLSWSSHPVNTSKKIPTGMIKSSVGSRQPLMETPGEARACQVKTITAPFNKLNLGWVR